MLVLAVVAHLCSVQVENGMHEVFSSVSPNMGPLLAKTYQVPGSGGPFGPLAKITATSDRAWSHFRSYSPDADGLFNGFR